MTKGIVAHVRGPERQRLYLLFTPSFCAADPWCTLDAAIDGGVDLVQWRVKQDDPGGAARCLATCTGRGVPMIVNDDVTLALRLAAAGAHVGQDDLPPRHARRLLAPGQWLGVSTHDLGQVAAAIAGGADHLGFGPMFPTTTKGYTLGQREGALAAAVAAAKRRPVFAIGGIDTSNVDRIVAEGVRRIAVSSAILQATDPARAAASLREALER